MLEKEKKERDREGIIKRYHKKRGVFRKSLREEGGKTS